MPRQPLARALPEQMSPDLFDASDYRRFIRMALERSQTTDRELAHAVGRSAPWVSLMMSHQRPMDPTLLPALVKALHLTEQEAIHLAALIDVDAPSSRARQSAWATVRANRAHLTSPGLQDEMVQAMSKWWVAATKELAACEGFQADPAWIASTLCPPIEEAQAEEALRVLVDLGELTPDEQGRLRPSPEPAWSPHDMPVGVQSTATTELHSALLKLADRSIHTHYQNEREAFAVTLTLSEEQYPKVATRLREMMSELVMLANESGEHPNRVYAMNVQMVPLSNFTDSSSSTN